MAAPTDREGTEGPLPVVLVLAVAENGVIGRGNALPWDLPDDLQHFKRVTMGCPIVMGRKTFESVGRPLPGRTNIVLTRDPDWHHPNVVVVNEVSAAIERAEQQALLDGAPALCVIGGAEIYRAFLPVADRIVLTEVHGTVSGDAFFDRAQIAGWRELSRNHTPAGTRNSHDFSVVELAPNH